MDAMRALKALKLSILTLGKTIYQPSNRHQEVKQNFFCHFTTIDMDQVGQGKLLL